jgi:outer membrane protein TolC
MLVANITAAESRLEADAARYDAILLTAIAEVEASYKSYAYSQTRQAKLLAARESANTAANSAQELYRLGAGELLTVLAAQALAAQQENELVQAQSLLETYHLAVLKSLGGGRLPVWPSRTASK